jgi:predicted GNAT family acetyltransferase
MAATEVTDNPARHRFEIRADGRLAGFAEYRLSEGGIEFTHTVVRDEYEGKGVGGTLVKHALESARERGLRVTPTCPFVRSYIEGHPAYADLVV